MQRYIVLNLSDGNNKYPFLYDGQTLYCPDCNPEKFGHSVNYCFATGTAKDQYRTQIIFSLGDLVACKQFRHEAYNYQQCIEVGPPAGQYISFAAWKENGPDPDFVGAQGAWFDPPIELYTEINIVADKDSPIQITWPESMGTTQKQLRDNLKKFYCPEASVVTLETEMVVMDDNDLYWHKQQNEGSDTLEYFGYALTDWPYSNNFQWKDGLKIASVLHIVLATDEGSMHIDIRSNPFTLTAERFAQLLQISTGKNIKIQAESLQDMNVIKPKFANKTVMEVVEMTAQTDSKSNIIQPVFFRVRDLASIVVHPEVTENICINLDAYKSQVDRFYIKIEGAAFPEIGRTEMGVIFKVKGSSLPKRLTQGVYYILNENTDLVTTGKYIYEA